VTNEEIIANQLAENTGRHFLDSGGAYGRMWERNQARAKATGQTILESFQAESRAWWDGYGVTLSAFHWMTEHLDYDAGMTHRLQRWINLSWIGLAQYERGRETNSCATIDEWIDLHVKKKWFEPHPEFGGWTNTYNHENLLSQDLLFTCFATTDKHPYSPDESFVAMSTHNGADARGGYSDFKIYRCDPYEMWDWDDFAAHCPQCEQHPDDPANTLFDQKPYVYDTYGYWYHRGGEWDTDVPNAGHYEPIFDPKWDKTPDDFELPDDFDQTGPICPIHYCNMEVT
jgi:hypothetical protein